MLTDEAECAADTLDPADWDGIRAQGHRMLDDMFDYLQDIRERPVWQPIPPDVRSWFRQTIPQQPADLRAVHETFMHDILPFSVGNAHPGFMGWVHGGGTAVGMLAEMLAAGLNANLGGRDQIPLEVERQVSEWVRTLFGFPDSATGLFVTGTSMANLIGVLVARAAALGTSVRMEGTGAHKLLGYASVAAHECVAKAFDISGLGTNALRRIPVNAQHQMDTSALAQAIDRDRAAGLCPFLIVGTAGTVDVGAVDDLARLSDIAKSRGLRLHVDGAFGALAMLSPEIAPCLRGITQADSIAFDFHKWGQVPYDAGFILVRDGALHRSAFAAPASYLMRETRGLAAGSPWPCDFGPDLSRGFRALKTWFTIQVYGAEKLGQVITHTCELAQYLKRCIHKTPQLELLAPVALNIVCFRYRSRDSDRVNADLVVRLQESGICAPSTTILNGQLAIRVAIVNHRTTQSDIDALLQATLALGRLCVESEPSACSAEELNEPKPDATTLVV